MIRISNINVPLDSARLPLKSIAAKKLNIKQNDIKSVKLLKKSIDARKKHAIKLVYTLAVDVSNEKVILKRFEKQSNISVYKPYKYVIPTALSTDKRPVIVGFGPAGIFASLILAKAGLHPIVIERGKPADERIKSVELFRSTGKLDTESNIQFGEGGAGTFSDGKLNTGVNDPRIAYVLETFSEHGAPEDILYNSKPHIGTDYLINVVQSIRKTIINCGGEVIFGARFTGYNVNNRGCLSSVSYSKNGEAYTVHTNKCILATGHSARDVFRMLKENNVELVQKSFAMGVRIEHLQKDLDRYMYGESAGHSALNAADYKLAVHLSNGRSLYTFCMCPGGEVVASASEEGRLVVNGMSCHARDGVNSNSALLVGITPEDFESDDPLAGMYFQEKLEEKAFKAGGGNYKAPVCLVGDFLAGKPSTAFGKIKPTYTPGTSFADLHEYLPEFMVETLRMGITEMAEKLALFSDSDAVLTGIESRSSSPVRILRNESYQSVTVGGLYPCGEGAGYAGGITSAAVDGIKCAEALISSYM